MRRPKTTRAAKQRAWKAISRYIRENAADDGGYVSCVSCGTPKHWKELHCGHYQHGLTYGQDDEYFVWEENLHPQCAGCNTYRGGMLDRYTVYMIDHYGREMVDELMDEKTRQKAKPLRMRIDDYWLIEQEYAGRESN